MIGKIISIKPNSKVSEIIKLMNKTSISQIPVIEKGKVVGLVTESNLLEKNSEEIKYLEAKDLMKESPPLISENVEISAIISLLKHFPIILVSKKGKLVGLITKADLINNLL
jgi:predicted transcriptional regulator